MLARIKVVSSLVKSGLRYIKFLRYGPNDVQQAQQIAAFGDDSNPPKGWFAVYAETATKGKPVVIGYFNKNQIAAVGEKRIFSTNSDGEVEFYIHMKANGTCEVGGSADNMVRFSKLKESVDELKNDLTTLKNVFTAWVPVPNDGGAALKTGSASWAGTALIKNIDAAKIDEIKTL